MEKVRQTLLRLGWPVERLSDGQIAAELRQRWFNNGGKFARPSETLSSASAMGILAAMSREGNLDALCWEHGQSETIEPESLGVPLDTFDPPEPRQDKPVRERRRSPRKKAKDLVIWSTSEAGGPEATGWLVCQANEGIAFIAEARDTPEAGATIRPRIHLRSGRIQDLGRATVVRIDPLSASLALVCAELEEALRPLGD